MGGARAPPAPPLATLLLSRLVSIFRVGLILKSFLKFRLGLVSGKHGRGKEQFTVYFLMAHARLWFFIEHSYVVQLKPNLCKFLLPDAA